MIEDPNLTAADALERGLVSQVVARRRAAAAARGEGGGARRQGAALQRMVKSLVWQSLDNSLADHLQLERHGIAESMGTEDLRNGVAAFFAGETPVFERSLGAAGPSQPGDPRSRVVAYPRARRIP